MRATSEPEPVPHGEAPPNKGRVRRSRRDKLPELLRPFFWEYDFDELTWQADRAMIIERLLSRGSWPTWRWLRDRMGDDALRDFLTETRGRALTPRQLRFWQLILGLPEKKVRLWMDAKKKSIWFSRTGHEATPRDPRLSTKKALELLGPPATARGLYLAGGTALALRLGHRLSVDFDWFSDARLDDPGLLAETLRVAGVPFATSMLAEGTLYGTVEGVQTSFLQYPYKRLRSLGNAREFRIASLDDLASMKLSAIVDRGSKKDFVDIFALCTKHRPLRELVGLYQRRFQTADVGHVLVALSYFDDAERTRMPRMCWDVDWKTIRRSIEGWIRDAAGRP